MMGVFLIPHSLHGSEIDWQAPEAQSSRRSAHLAIVTADSQVINVDLGDPTLVYLWSLFQSPGFATAVVPWIRKISSGSSHLGKAKPAIGGNCAFVGLVFSRSFVPKRAGTVANNQL